MFHFKQKITVNAILVLGLLLILSVYYFVAEEYALSCPFKKMTGLDCPGCGSQRAFHELMHFRIKSAFQYNQLLVLSIPYFLVLLFFSIFDLKSTFPKIYNFFFGNKTILFLLIVLLLFFVWRNF